MARTITFQKAINEALDQEMARDPSVVLFGEDVAGGQGPAASLDAWGGARGDQGPVPQVPGRVLDTPISESAFIRGRRRRLLGPAPGRRADVRRLHGGLLRPDLQPGAKLRYMFGGKARVPMVIRTMWGAGIRAASQHSQSLYSIFTHVPGLKVAVPSNPYDAKGLLIAPSATTTR